jgi:SIS domain
MSSPRWSGNPGQLHRYGGRAGSAAGAVAVRFPYPGPHLDRRLRHGFITPVSACGSSASRTCRSRSTSRRSSAPLGAGNLAIFVSQSGETADTLASLRHAREHKQHILSIVNVPASTVARESDITMPALAGPEIGVASTKAFTCQLAAMVALAIAAGRARGVLSQNDEQRLVHALIEVPRDLAKTLAIEPQIEQLARGLAKHPQCALSLLRHEPSDRARRRAQAQGNLLHSRRRLRRRRSVGASDQMLRQRNGLPRRPLNNPTAPRPHQGRGMNARTPTQVRWWPARSNFTTAGGKPGETTQQKACSHA